MEKKNGLKEQPQSWHHYDICGIKIKYIIANMACISAT